MEGKIGLIEILIIVAIALLLFGPSKFASLGKGLGEGIRNFKVLDERAKRKNEGRREEVLACPPELLSPALPLRNIRYTSATGNPTTLL